MIAQHSPAFLYPAVGCFAPIARTGMYRLTSIHSKWQSRNFRKVSCHRMMSDFDPPLFLGTLAVGAVALALWETKPTGGVDELSVLGISNSTVQNAGLGLFLLESRNQGTVLGSYPGRVWGAGEWLRFKGSPEVQFRARQYVWRLQNGNIIDPTNEDGFLEDFVPWILPFSVRMPISGPSTVLARINEPGKFGDTNVITEERGDKLLLVLERTVSAGEELFMDYGPYYDRSHYRGPGTLLFADD